MTAPRFGTGLVINLDRSPHRYDSFMRHTAEHFEQIIRVPAVDRNDLDLTDVHAFRDAARATAERYPQLNMAPRTTDSFWAGAAAVYQSHILAVRRGQALGTGFIVLEDDARLRADLLAATDDPPADAVAVWGGALNGGSYMTHHRRYAKWRAKPGANPWQHLDGAAAIRGRCQATAYHLPVQHVATWLDSIESNPQSYDVAWWAAMLAVPTYALRIEVAYQDLLLGSDRSAASSQAHSANLARLREEQ